MRKDEIVKKPTLAKIFGPFACLDQVLGFYAAAESCECIWIM